MASHKERPLIVLPLTGTSEYNFEPILLWSEGVRYFLIVEWPRLLLARLAVDQLLPFHDLLVEKPKDPQIQERFSIELHLSNTFDAPH